MLAELGQQHGRLVVDAHGVGVGHHNVAEAGGVGRADGHAASFGGLRGIVPLHRRQARLQGTQLAAHAPGNGFAMPGCEHQERQEAHAGGIHKLHPLACGLHLLLLLRRRRVKPSN